MTNILKYAGIVALVVSIVVAVKVFAPIQANTLGAVGNQLIEQYDPYVRYNGGINSALPIQTSGTLTGGALTAAAATFSGNVTVTTSNSATSSATVGCVNTYATSTATAIKLFPGAINASASTTYTGGTVGGFVVWAYGTCP